MMNKHTLYKLTFPNNKVYIGQTKNFRIRMNGHKNDSFNPNRFSRNCQINNAIRKYGWEATEKEIILTCFENEIDSNEIKYISLYKSTNRSFGYNREGGGNKKKNVSEYSKKLISEARKGKRSWGKPVLQLDAQTKKVIRKWDCITDAARTLNASAENIGSMCNNRTQVCCIKGKKYFCKIKTVKGFKWEFYKVLTLV